MKIFPSDSLYFSSALTPEQVRGRMHELFELGPRGSWNEPRTWLSGRLTGDGFRAGIHAQNYRSSFSPIATGVFQPVPGGTRIDVRFRMHRVVFILIMLIVGWLLADVVIVSLTEEQKHPGVAVMLTLLALLFFSLPTAAYRHDQRKMVRTLERAFEAPHIQHL
jgi:hypothetical protein